MADVKTEAQEIRENAEALKSWMNSLGEQVKEASGWTGGGYGIERASRDALDATFRIASSVCHALEQTAKALDRLEQRENA